MAVDEVDLSILGEEAAPAGMQKAAPAVVNGVDLSVLDTPAGVDLSAEVAMGEELPRGGPSQLETFGRALGQGATLGFQDNLVAAVNASVEGMREFATGFSSLAPGKGFADKYETELNRLRGVRQEGEEAFPGTALVGDIVGSLPRNIATGGAGLLADVTLSGAQAGAETIGKSGKGLTKETGTEALKDAMFAAGLTGLFRGGAKFLKTRGGDLIVRKGKDSFNLGKATAEAMDNPDVQKKITQEIVDIPGSVDSLIKTTKSSVGTAKDQLLQQVGDVPVSISKKELRKTIGQLQKFETPVDELAGRAKDDLIRRTQTILSRLDPSGSADDIVEIPLKQLQDIKEELGQVVYQQRVYRKAPEINRVAKNLERTIAENIAKADEIAGTGGELRDINKIFTALYDMEGKVQRGLSPATIKGLTDPQNATALKSYQNFIAKFADVPDNLKVKYAPELTSKFAVDIPNTTYKAQLMRMITGRDPAVGFSSADMARGIATGTLTANPIAGTLAATPQNVRLDALNKLGAALGSVDKAAGKLGKAGKLAVRTPGAVLGGTMREGVIELGRSMGTNEEVSLEDEEF